MTSCSPRLPPLGSAAPAAFGWPLGRLLGPGLAHPMQQPVTHRSSGALQQEFAPISVQDFQQTAKQKQSNSWLWSQGLGIQGPPSPHSTTHVISSFPPLEPPFPYPFPSPLLSPLISRSTPPSTSFTPLSPPPSQPPPPHCPPTSSAVLAPAMSSGDTPSG